MTAEYPKIPGFLATAQLLVRRHRPRPRGPLLGRPADSRPLDRSSITAFAEPARAPARAPVADLGSGPGSVPAHPAAPGPPGYGVGLSPGVVALARHAHPELRFPVGSMTALDLPERTPGGIVALYSVIHVPDDHLPATLAQFHRVLLPGAPVPPASRSLPPNRALPPPTGCG